jgi:hypothetical protein
MTSQVTAAAPPYEDAQVAGVACLLLALEKADTARVVFRPLARLGEDFVAATVMIDVGEGALPFTLESVRLAALCLRADPPFPASVGLAARLSSAADQAEAAALRLMSALH